MEQDIHRLIERFMAGLTSIEEERFIADYLRTHEVDGDLLPYKRMFAWFDEGIPMKESAEKEQTDLSVPPHVPRHAKGGSRPALLRKVSYFIMAAAAAALLFAVVWPRTEPRRMANNVTVEALPDEKAPVAKPDTLASDTTTTIVAPKKKTRRKIRRDRFKPLPPKVYLAETATDSVAKDAEMRAEKMIKEAELEQEQMINAICEEYRRVSASLDLYIIAMESYDVEEELY